MSIFNSKDEILKINLHFNQFKLLNPKFDSEPWRKLFYLFSWQLYRRTVSCIVSLTKEDQSNLIKCFITLLYFFINVQLQFLVFVIWVKLMNISFESLNNSTVGNSTTFILTRRNMGKDTTVKVSAWTDMYLRRIWKTDLNINIIVCFFCQLYEDCKER